MTCIHGEGYLVRTLIKDSGGNTLTDEKWYAMNIHLDHHKNVDKFWEDARKELAEGK